MYEIFIGKMRGWGINGGGGCKGRDRGGRGKIYFLER